VLREDRGAGFVRRQRFPLGPRFTFQSGGRIAARSLGRRAHARLLEEQRLEPVPVLADDGRTWWLFMDRCYWENEGYEADDVKALALASARRRQRRLEAAHDLLRAEAEGAPRREPIPEAIRRLVFRRDGGRCTRCGGDELLQFDHVIPVALGGAGTAENLQLLCATCNREKGGSL
jgi:HNH endonuclease